MRRKALVAALTLPAFLLAGCTLGSVGSGLPVGTTSATLPVTPVATPTGSDDEPAAAWESMVNYAGTGPQARPVHVRLQPLLRIQDGVLLTVELNLAESSPSTGVFAPFCTGESCRDLSGISLIDTASRTRFGPLRSGQAGPMMTSSVGSFSMKPGMTYRFGALFPDPGTASVAVDLQQAGVALAVPIVAGFPVGNLISTQPPPADGWNPQPVIAGTVVTAPIPAVTGSYGQDQHRLVARIVGEPVSAAPGLVTLSSDRLFHTGASTFRPAATALITRAASIVAAHADPGQPVAVVAFTDPAGTAALTRAQARVVASELAVGLKQFTLVQAGAGSADPVAANTTSTGRPSSPGRALNRRIELSFTSQDAGDVSAVSGAAPVTASPMTTGSPSPGVTLPPPMTPPATGTATGTAPPAGTSVGPAAAEPGTNARFTAQVEAVEVDGAMTLVRLRIWSDANANPVGAFSAQGGKHADVGAFNVTDPATGRVYVPMSDAGNMARVTGVFTHRFTSRVTYEYTFFVAALPAGLTTVDVALAGLGTARGVSVSH